MPPPTSRSTSTGPAASRGDGHPVLVDAVEVAWRLVALEEVQRQPVVRDLERAIVRPGDRRQLAGDPGSGRWRGAGGNRECGPLGEAAAGARARAAVLDVLGEDVQRHARR